METDDDHFLKMKRNALEDWRKGHKRVTDDDESGALPAASLPSLGSGRGDGGHRGMGRGGYRGRGDGGHRGLGRGGYRGRGDGGHRGLGRGGYRGRGDGGHRGMGDEGHRGMGDVGHRGMGDVGYRGMGDGGYRGMGRGGYRGRGDGGYRGMGRGGYRGRGGGKSGFGSWGQEGVSKSVYSINPLTLEKLQSMFDEKRFRDVVNEGPRVPPSLRSHDYYSLLGHANMHLKLFSDAIHDHLIASTMEKTPTTCFDLAMAYKAALEIDPNNEEMMSNFMTSLIEASRMDDHFTPAIEEMAMFHASGCAPSLEKVGELLSNAERSELSPKGRALLLATKLNMNHPLREILTLANEKEVLPLSVPYLFKWDAWPKPTESDIDRYKASIAALRLIHSCRRQEGTEVHKELLYLYSYDERELATSVFSASLMQLFLSVSKSEHARLDEVFTDQEDMYSAIVIARTMIGRGDYRKAIPFIEYQMARQNAPRDPSFNRLLAVCCEKIGDFGNADRAASTAYCEHMDRKARKSDLDLTEDDENELLKLRSRCSAFLGDESKIHDIASLISPSMYRYFSEVVLIPMNKLREADDIQMDLERRGMKRDSLALKAQISLSRRQYEMVLRIADELEKADPDEILTCIRLRVTANINLDHLSAAQLILKKYPKMFWDLDAKLTLRRKLSPMQFFEKMHRHFEKNGQSLELLATILRFARHTNMWNDALSRYKGFLSLEEKPPSLVKELAKGAIQFQSRDSIRALLDDLERFDGLPAFKFVTGCAKLALLDETGASKCFDQVINLHDVEKARISKALLLLSSESWDFLKVKSLLEVGDEKYARYATLLTLRTMSMQKVQLTADMKGRIHRLPDADLLDLVDDVIPPCGPFPSYMVKVEKTRKLLNDSLHPIMDDTFYLEIANAFVDRRGAELGRINQIGQKELHDDIQKRFCDSLPKSSKKPHIISESKCLMRLNRVCLIRPELYNELRRGKKNIAVCSDSPCGRSTEIPFFLSTCDSIKGKILSTQPNVSLVPGMCHVTRSQMSKSGSGVVGFMTEFEKKESTKINFASNTCTMDLLSDCELNMKGYGCVIVEEMSHWSSVLILKKLKYMQETTHKNLVIVINCREEDLHDLNLIPLFSVLSVLPSTFSLSVKSMVSNSNVKPKLFHDHLCSMLRHENTSSDSNSMLEDVLMIVPSKIHLDRLHDYLFEEIKKKTIEDMDVVCLFGPLCVDEQKKLWKSRHQRTLIIAPMEYLCTVPLNHIHHVIVCPFKDKEIGRSGLLYRESSLLSHGDIVYIQHMANNYGNGLVYVQSPASPHEYPNMRENLMGSERDIFLHAKQMRMPDIPDFWDARKMNELERKYGSVHIGGSGMLNQNTQGALSLGMPFELHNFLTKLNISEEDDAMVPACVIVAATFLHGSVFELKHGGIDQEVPMDLLDDRGDLFTAWKVYHAWRESDRSVSWAKEMKVRRGAMVFLEERSQQLYQAYGKKAASVIPPMSRRREDMLCKVFVRSFGSNHFARLYDDEEGEAQWSFWKSDPSNCIKHMERKPRLSSHRCRDEERICFAKYLFVLSGATILQDCTMTRRGCTRLTNVRRVLQCIYQPWLQPCWASFLR
eukprot:TRINITY_DN1684_c0_g1_i2.p1 TRINITY_DN1684_c0_g1~~TRINITY_DN1684_c0_g1_i2.p1  ORF type:complete len:1629 (+),score=421.67 TRINITY_DN1684_c0_g1_i2:88-4887(+)